MKITIFVSFVTVKLAKTKLQSFHFFKMRHILNLSTHKIRQIQF